MKCLWDSRLALVIIGIVYVLVPKMIEAQSQIARHHTFSGLYDAGFPYPIVEGQPGQKDEAALQEIHEATLACSPMNWPGIEATGTITMGSRQNSQQRTGRLIMEKDNRFRLDVQSSEGSTSIRVHQWAGQAKHDGSDAQLLHGVQLGDYFVLPSQLWETANKANVRVIDDGTVSIDDARMHAVTIVTSVFRKLAASTFYFDPATHHLLKSVVARSDPGNTFHEYLKVITYSDYRQVQGEAVPFSYSETYDGQPGLTFHAQDVVVTSDHANAYYHF